MGSIIVLPAIPSGEEITAVNLTLGLYSNNSPSFNVDLYALRSNSIATFYSIQVPGPGGLVDAYEGPNDPTAATKIVDDFIIPSSALGNYSLGAAAQTTLASWLQSQYDGGAVAGDYVFFRTNADVASAASAQYRFNSGNDNQGAGGTYTVPVLSITSDTPPVPEPNTLGLFALAGLVAMRLRRRRCMRS